MSSATSARPLAVDPRRAGRADGQQAAVGREVGAGGGLVEPGERADRLGQRGPEQRGGPGRAGWRTARPLARRRSWPRPPPGPRRGTAPRRRTGPRAETGNTTAGRDRQRPLGRPRRVGLVEPVDRPDREPAVVVPDLAEEEVALVVDGDVLPVDVRDLRRRTRGPACRRDGRRTGPGGCPSRCGPRRSRGVGGSRRSPTSPGSGMVEPADPLQGPVRTARPAPARSSQRHTSVRRNPPHRRGTRRLTPQPPGVYSPPGRRDHTSPLEDPAPITLLATISESAHRTAILTDAGQSWPRPPRIAGRDVETDVGGRGLRHAARDVKLGLPRPDVPRRCSWVGCALSRPRPDRCKSPKSGRGW